MKRLLVIVMTVSGSLSYAQSIGIGTINPHASARLEVNSTSAGLLPPRLTAAQRDAIQTPAAGLMLWCSNCGLAGEMQVYNGTTWTNMVGNAKSAPEAQLCSQRWAVQNLGVSTYRNGEPIPKVTDNAAWQALTTGAYCYYNNDSATYAAVYGKLYNWYAVTDPRGLAPAGWHIPSIVEWDDLVTCAGGMNAAGGPLKDTGTLYWLTPNQGATNSSGFTARPGGFRSSDGTFIFISIYGAWWTTTPWSAIEAYFRMFSYATTAAFYGNQSKRDGYSVRVLRD